MFHKKINIELTSFTNSVAMLKEPSELGVMGYFLIAQTTSFFISVFS